MENRKTKDIFLSVFASCIDYTRQTKCQK